MTPHTLASAHYQIESGCIYRYEPWCRLKPTYILIVSRWSSFTSYPDIVIASCGLCGRLLPTVNDPYSSQLYSTHGCTLNSDERVESQESPCLPAAKASGQNPTGWSRLQI